MQLKQAQIRFLWSSAKLTPETRTVAESIHAETVSTPRNPYGQVDSGRLTIKGQVLKATARPFEIGRYDYFHTRNLLSMSGDDIGRADFDETVWPTQPFWCVPLQFFPKAGQLFGLIVMPLEIDPAGSFELGKARHGASEEITCVRIGRFNSAMQAIFDNAETRTIVVE